jgi:tetratricopeptide (TPR) repeat protein
MSVRIPILALLFVTASFARTAAPPHDDLERQIAAVTKELSRSPGDEALLVQRANLYRLHRQWDEAFADLAQVRRTRETGPFVLVRARLFRDLDYLRAATTELDGHLSRAPGDTSVRLLRAEVLERRGMHARALADLDRAIGELDPPQPDQFVDRARVAAACAELGKGALERALAGLDQGMERLGPIPALQLAAIDLELERARHDAALERLATLAAQGGRQERWLARRGDILFDAGRREAAGEAYQAALSDIRSLKTKHRRTPLVRDLEAHALDRLRVLARPDKARPKTPH